MEAFILHEPKRLLLVLVAHICDFGRCVWHSALQIIYTEPRLARLRADIDLYWRIAFLVVSIGRKSLKHQMGRSRFDEDAICTDEPVSDKGVVRHWALDAAWQRFESDK